MRREARVEQDNRLQSVHLEVVPLRHSERDYFLICIQRVDPASTGAIEPAGPVGRRKLKRRDEDLDGAVRTGRGASALRRTIADLHRDLAEAREDARSLKEEHDAVLEEMTSASEECTSANEELQSVNEEVESAKEELESANEELTTVNDEMLKQNEVLARTAANLSNTEKVAAMEILTVDREGVLRRFTPSAAARFALKAVDLGRPLRALDGVPAGLGKHVAETIAENKPVSLEVKDPSDRWTAVRIAPYVGPSDSVEGAILSFYDIDAKRRAESVVKEARDFAEAIVRTVRDGLLVADAELHIVRANEAFYGLFRTSEAEVLGRSVFDLSAGQWNTPIMHNRLDDMAERNSTFDGLEMTHEIAGYGRRTFLVGGRTLREPGVDAIRILISIRDITEAVQFQVRDRADAELFRRLFETSADGRLLANAETGAIHKANEVVVKMLGITAEAALLLSLGDLALWASDGPIRIDLAELRSAGTLHIDSCTLRSASGGSRTVEIRCRVHHDVLAPYVVVNVRSRGSNL